MRIFVFAVVSLATVATAYSIGAAHIKQKRSAAGAVHKRGFDEALISLKQAGVEVFDGFGDVGRGIEQTVDNAVKVVDEKVVEGSRRLRDGWTRTVNGIKQVGDEVKNTVVNATRFAADRVRKEIDEEIEDIKKYGRAAVDRVRKEIDEEIEDIKKYGRAAFHKVNVTVSAAANVAETVGDAVENSEKIIANAAKEIARKPPATAAGNPADKPKPTNTPTKKSGDSDAGQDSGPETTTTENGGDLKTTTTKNGGDQKTTTTEKNGGDQKTTTTENGGDQKTTTTENGGDPKTTTTENGAAGKSKDKLLKRAFGRSGRLVSSI